MSGGSYDYICYKLQDVEIRYVHTDPRRAAFQQLLKLVAEAMHDIEWVDSSDYGKGDEHAAIDKCMAFLSPDAETIVKARAFDALTLTLKEYLK